MQTKLIEVTNGPHNHGKFLIGQFDEEWTRPCLVDPSFGTTFHRALLHRCGWTPEHTLVFDLQTGEGALFRLGGLARADLNKTRIWVCPLFEPFLTWLYAEVRKDATDWFAKLPEQLDLPNAPFAMHGYRREGREP